MRAQLTSRSQHCCCSCCRARGPQPAVRRHAKAAVASEAASGHRGDPRTPYSSPMIEGAHHGAQWRVPNVLLAACPKQRASRVPGRAT